MNTHLNLFNTYTKENRAHQLENDLTRALAICLIQDRLFLYEVLSFIVDEKEGLTLSNLINSETTLDIDIQKNVNQIVDCSKVYAVSISGIEMNSDVFFNQPKPDEKDYITDLFIGIDDYVIIAEVKPNASDCTNQLYNQAYFAVNSEGRDSESMQKIVPVDLNWKKLMLIADKVINFQKALNHSAQFLEDFYVLIQQHNYRWIPISPFSRIIKQINFYETSGQRLNAALNSISKIHDILSYSDRVGLKSKVGWANEMVIYNGDKKEKTKDFWFGFWPGNTKGQGNVLHELIKPNWRPPKFLNVNDKEFEIHWGYEIKFCHFNKYVSNIVVHPKDIREGKVLFSSKIHESKTGKYDRKDWGRLEHFLDDTLESSVKWRSQIWWNKKFVKSDRNYLTMSIGLQLLTKVPIEYLVKIDTDSDDISNFSNLIIGVKESYENILK